jgi:hypothetical protein
MLTKARAIFVVALVIALLFAVWLLLALNCPSVGIAFTSRARQLHRLKNRTTFPQATDFDASVTLTALLQLGDDTSRWSTDHAARIQAEVIDVAYARPEATNCFSPCRRDLHILVANRKGAPKNEQVVLEVTPNLREWATTQGIDWSEKTLQAQLIGHWCEFEGWLYFDVGHSDQSENTASHNPGNWRATAWEVHPVTRIRVLR